MYVCVDLLISWPFKHQMGKSKKDDEEEIRKKKEKRKKGEKERTKRET